MTMFKPYPKGNKPYFYDFPNDGSTVINGNVYDSVTLSQKYGRSLHLSNFEGDNATVTQRDSSNSVLFGPIDNLFKNWAGHYTSQMVNGLTDDRKTPIAEGVRNDVTGRIIFVDNKADTFPDIHIIDPFNYEELARIDIDDVNTRGRLYYVGQAGVECYYLSTIDGATPVIVTINTSTYTKTTSASLAGGSVAKFKPNFICKSGAFVYVLLNSNYHMGNSSGYGAWLIKIDTNTGIMTSIETIYVNNQTGGSIPTEGLEIGSTGVYEFVLQNDVDTTRYTLDTNNDTLTNEVYTEVPMMAHRVVNTSTIWESERNSFMVTVGGVTYCSMQNVEVQQSSNIGNVLIHGWSKLATVNPMTFSADVPPVDTDWVAGFYMKLDSLGHELVAIEKTTYTRYAWDEAGGQYVKVASINTSGSGMAYFGMDSSGRVWGWDSDGLANVLDSLIPQTYTVTIGLPTNYTKFVYGGVPVPSAINVSVKDRLGNFIATNVDLTLDGNGFEFDANNSDAITLATLDSGVLAVPINIVGTGTVRVQGTLAV